MDDERLLLKQFRQSGSSEDFEPIVSQYVNLVYSTALRIFPQQRAQVEDICQTVFADLSRKADVIPDQTPLAGWLYRHTCFIAQNHQRSEYRRQERERQAAEMNADNNADQGPDVPSEELHLAMNELADGDRDALVLRFLDERDLRGVGNRLGISEDAAQKRVSRALDKLRTILLRKGISATAAALTLALSQQITAAPSTLAAKTLAAAAVGSTLSTGLFPTMIELMKTPFAKFAAIIAIGGGAAVGFNQQHMRISDLRHENAELAGKVSALASLQSENERLKQAAIAPSDLARLREQAQEVHRLRGEIGLLRRAMANPPSSPTPNLPHPVAEETAPVAPETAIQLECRIIGHDITSKDSANVIKLHEFSGVITEPQRIALLKTLVDAPGVDVLSAPRVISQNGEQANVSITETLKIVSDYKLSPAGELEPVETDIRVGPVVYLTPTHDPANNAIRLDVEFELNEFHGYDESDPNSVPTPIIGKVQMAVAAMVAQGQTLLLSGKSKGRPNGILLLVTPKTLDQATIAAMNAKVPPPAAYPVAGDPTVRAAPPVPR